jgi:hypothetical protein
LPDISEYSDGEYAAPLALAQGLSLLFDTGEGVPPGRELLAPLAAYLSGDAHSERRLLALRTDLPRPVWPDPMPRTWPICKDKRTSYTPLLLILERTGDEVFDAAALAVARYSQQRIWERSGTLLPLISPEAFETRYKRAESPVLRFGLLQGQDGSLLSAGPEPGKASSSFSIRSTDAAAMRLVYAVEPFFRSIGPEGETWTLP